MEHSLERYMYGWQRGAAGKEPKPDMLTDGEALRGHQHGTASRFRAFELERDRLGLASGSNTLREMAPPEMRASRGSSRAEPPTAPIALPAPRVDLTTASTSPIDPLDDPMFKAHAAIRARGIQPIRFSNEVIYTQYAIALHDLGASTAPGEDLVHRERLRALDAVLDERKIGSAERAHGIDTAFEKEAARRSNTPVLASASPVRNGVPYCPGGATPCLVGEYAQCPCCNVRVRAQHTGAYRFLPHARQEIPANGSARCICGPTPGASDEPCPIHS